MPAVVPTGFRLLRVVPDGDGGWSIRERRTGEVLGGAATSEAAAAEATQLLPWGGLVEVVDEGDFIIARAHVPPPPVPWPTWARRASLSLGVAVIVGLLVGWLLDFHAFAVLLGMALGAQAVNLCRLLVARRSRRDAGRRR